MSDFTQLNLVYARWDSHHHDSPKWNSSFLDIILSYFTFFYLWKKIDLNICAIWGKSEITTINPAFAFNIAWFFFCEINIEEVNILLLMNFFLKPMNDAELTLFILISFLVQGKKGLTEL